MNPSERSPEPTEPNPEKLREKQARMSALRGPWHAACQNGHAYWAGPDRNTEAEARADADAHDKARHNGKATALVLAS